MRVVRTYIPPVAISILLIIFILFRWYVIDLSWEGISTPPALDDSLSYIARIRVIGDTGSYFYDLKYIWSWYRNDHLTFLPWSTSLALVKLLSNSSYLDVFKTNFYFGIVILSFTILNMLKVLERDRIFWVTAFSFLTLYNGSGYYHGFFWVVPSFYSVIATFLLISIIFDERGIKISEKRWFVLLFLITLLLLWLHPFGKFSYVAIGVSFIIHIFLNKILHSGNSTMFLLRRVALIMTSGLIAFFSVDVLPYSMGIVPYTYPSTEQLIHSISSSYDLFVKLYLDYFGFTYHTVLLAIGLFAMLFNRKTSILSIFLGFFVISLVGSLLNRAGYRILVYLWPLTFLIYSYGCYFLIQRLITLYKANSDQKLRIIFKAKTSKKIQLNKNFILFSSLIVLISVSCIYPFMRGNYDFNLKFANYLKKNMEGLEVDRSIVEYLTNVTNPGDLIIFADSEAFITVTSLGLLDREVAYANWDWSGEYAFLQDKVNGTYLVASSSPYKKALFKKTSLADNMLNLTEAFGGRLTLLFVKNFSLVSLYKIIIEQMRAPSVFDDEAINPILTTEYEESIANNLRIFTQILPYFFVIMFLPGLMWVFFLFRIRDLLSMVAFSFGLSVLLIFLTMLSVNLVFDIAISKTSTVLVITILTMFPLVLHFLGKNHVRFKI